MCAHQDAHTADVRDIATAMIWTILLNGDGRGERAGELGIVENLRAAVNKARVASLLGTDQLLRPL